MKTKKIAGEITAGDADARTIEFIASHEKVDRDGEVIDVGGIEIDEYELNPVLLTQHNSRAVAVGTVTSMRKTVLGGAAALICRAVLPDRPQSNEALADIRGGLLNSVSIGFRSLAVGPPRLKGQTGLTHTRIKLLEISLVTLPSCPTCLITSKSACGCDELKVQMPRSLEESLACASDSLTRSLARSLAGAIAPVVFPELAEADVTLTNVNKRLSESVSAVVADTIRSEVRRQLLYAVGKVE